MGKISISQPALDGAPWPVMGVAYLMYLNHPWRFADLLGVTDAKLRWAIAASSNSSHFLLWSAGNAAKVAQKDAKQSGGIMEHRWMRYDSSNRDERREIREFVGFPVYLRQLSDAFRVAASTPKTEDISFMEARHLLRRARMLLDAALPPDPQREQLRARLRVCAILSCGRVFIMRTPAGKYCPPCSREPSKQKKWWRTLSKEQRRARKKSWGIKLT